MKFGESVEILGVDSEVPFKTQKIDLRLATRSVLPNVSPADKYISLRNVMIPHLVEMARQSRIELAHSYRDFIVGAAFFAVDIDQMIARTVFGGNNTPEKGAPWNCAEKLAKEALDSMGGNYKVEMIAVVGEMQADDATGIESKTLPPCTNCRGMLATDDSFSPRTLVVTSLPDASEVAITNVDQLSRVYGSNPGDASETTPDSLFDIHSYPGLHAGWLTFVNGLDPAVRARDTEELNILSRISF